MKKIICTIVTMVTMLFSASAYAQQDTTVVDNETLKAIVAQGSDRGCWHPEIVDGFSASAYAQQDTTVVNRETLQAIFAQGSDRGCWHPEIKEGVCRKCLCYGWVLSAGFKVAMINWKSELGKGKSFSPAPTVTIGYKDGHWQPEVSFSYLIGVEVENQKLNSSELTLSARYNFNKHNHKGGLRAYVAPTATYRDMKSVDVIDLGPEWEVFKNPFHGHYFAVGGKFGFELKVAELIKHRSTTVGSDNFFLDIVGNVSISGEVGCDHGLIYKLRNGETNTSLKLNTAYAKLSCTLYLP